MKRKRHSQAGRQLHINLIWEWEQMENQMAACVEQAKQELGNVGLFAITFRAQQLYRATYPAMSRIEPPKGTEEQQESDGSE